MCSSGCPTPGKHKTFGECLRSKNLQVQDVEAHKHNTAQSKALDDYRAARRDGLQPESLSPKHVRQAREITDLTGVPYRADNR